MPDEQDVDPSILGLAPDERDDRGIDDRAVARAFRWVLEHGDREEKDLRGVSLPAIELDYAVIDPDEKHAVDLRGATIEAIDARHADLRVALDLEGATIGSLELEDVRVGEDVRCDGATIEGTLSAREARFEGNVEFSDATFEGDADFEEATFGDDTRFDGAAFWGDATFRGADLYGESNRLEDNTSFEGSTFAGVARFSQASLGYVDLRGATFEADLAFDDLVVDGDADLRDVAFHGDATFDEARFARDVTFEGATFRGAASFRGASFEGGDSTLEDDAGFEGVTFRGDADFEFARFEHVAFHGATFGGRAGFEEATFHDDAEFREVAFEGLVDFDEARFREDASFAGSRFAAPAVFRGAEFLGGANHLEADADFSNVGFEADADFDAALFGSADFTGVGFAGEADFEGATFEDEFEFLARADGGYVDFTGAKLMLGRIVQPAAEWVRYDLTHASVGDVHLDSERDPDRRELLDYFRFCETEFSEFDGYDFDFSDHTGYLDRNGWALHEFDDDAIDADYAAPLTPETIERTYLKAKIAASAAGNRKAAGEFRVKRQEFARKKSLAIARDSDEELGTRARNLTRAAENAFLGITCGHGMRLPRILAVFALFPLFPAFLYAFGGSAFRTGAGQLSSLGALLTPEGQAIFYKNLHFSYITFLTIGYGGIGPKGALARLLAGAEVYVSVILGGLVLYVLVKRSEV